MHACGCESGGCTSALPAGAASNVPAAEAAGGRSQIAATSAIPAPKTINATANEFLYPVFICLFSFRCPRFTITGVRPRDLYWVLLFPYTAHRRDLIVAAATPGTT